jgi:hypothetical protein
LELVKGRLLEGPGGLDWTDYCVCDLMLLIAVKGKADTVLIETEDRTPLGLWLEGPLKRVKSTGQPISETRGDSGGEIQCYTLVSGSGNVTIRCLAKGVIVGNSCETWSALWGGEI